MNYFHKSLIAILALTANCAFADSTVYQGATVHTMGPSGTLENATVVVTDGLFAAVGENVAVPEGANVIDSAGKIITPGFFSAMGQIGITEVSGVDGSVDYQQVGDEFSASFDVAKAYNPRSVLIPVNRAGGVTRALTAPTAGGDFEAHTASIFSGLAAVVQLGENSPHVAKREAAMIVNLGERGSGLSGGSRAAAMQALQAALNDAQDYGRHKDAFDRGQRRDYSLSMADLDALQGVLSARIPLVANVNRASDIEMLIELANEYRLKIIIYGGAEAWMVADELAAARISVILDSKSNLPTSFDAINARLESAAILVAAGVDISFGGDWQSETFVARNIAQSAGNAVANGLPWIDALEAITIAPARMYGVADQVGSIEVGKQADLIVWSADPIELTSNPEEVMINGEIQSLSNRQTMLRDRYMQTDSNEPPAYRN